MPQRVSEDKPPGGALSVAFQQRCQANVRGGDGQRQGVALVGGGVAGDQTGQASFQQRNELFPALFGGGVRRFVAASSSQPVRSQRHSARQTSGATCAQPAGSAQ